MTRSLYPGMVRRCRRLIGVVAALVAVSGLALAANPLAAHALPDPTAAEGQFLALLNQARAANGQAPLARDGALDGVARDWSTHMTTTYATNGGVVVDQSAPTDCNRSALCHRPDLGPAVTAASPGWTAAGENIGVGVDVQALHDSFMNSPGHRANVLGDYNRVGIGVVASSDKVWVTFDFVKGAPAPAPAGSSAPVADPAASTPITALATDGRFTAAKPQRVVDTRSGLGVAAGAVPANGTLAVPMAGRGQVPASATGVVVNVTATGTTGDGYLTIYPCGTTTPTSSTLNFVAGSSVPNLATTGLGADGNLCVFANVTTDVVIDLAGWYRDGSGAAFSGQAPVRVLDTRPAGQPIQSAVVDLKGKVPSGAKAVAVNITATQPVAAGYVTAYPCGSTAPDTSNVNYTAGATVANAAIVPLGAGGTICLASPVPTQLVVDLAGSFAGSGTDMTAVTPARLLDTRAGVGGWLGRLGAGQTIDLAVGGRPGVAGGARSAVFNVTVTGAASDGYLTVYPCGTPVPTASNVNFRAGDTRANQVTVDLGANGRACFFANAPTDVVADLTGYLH